MSAMVFAFQAPDDAQIEGFVPQLLAPTPAPTQAWALVDMALLQAEAREALMRSDRQGRMENAFEATPLAAFGEQAPHLLALPDDADALRQVLRWLFRCATNAPAISWLRSASPQAALRQTFATLAQVRIAQRKAPVHCRFADTRVLPELLRVLAPSQQRQLAATIPQWAWPTRVGLLETWRGDAQDEADGAEHAMLTLTVEQFRRLQHAAEPDGLFLMLCQQTPELVPASDLGQFHGRLARMLATAETLGVKEVEDKLQFIVLSLSCGEDFHRVEALQPTWRAVAAGGHLCLLMQAWDDALWERLDARDGKVG